MSFISSHGRLLNTMSFDVHSLVGDELFGGGENILYSYRFTYPYLSAYIRNNIRIFVVMNFGDYIVRVAGRLIVPKYDALERVVSLKYGRVGKSRYYEIIYILKKDHSPISDSMKLDIILETQSLGVMVGIEDHEDYSVYFSDKKRIRKSF